MFLELIAQASLDADRTVRVLEAPHAGAGPPHSAHGSRNALLEVSDPGSCVGAGPCPARFKPEGRKIVATAQAVGNGMHGWHSRGQGRKSAYPQRSLTSYSSPCFLRSVRDSSGKTREELAFSTLSMSAMDAVAGIDSSR